MPQSLQLDSLIRGYVDDLDALVSVKGFALTDPTVVEKSMELDKLILLAMRKPSYKRKVSAVAFKS